MGVNMRGKNKRIKNNSKIIKSRVDMLDYQVECFIKLRNK